MNTEYEHFINLRNIASACGLELDRDRNEDPDDFLNDWVYSLYNYKAGNLCIYGGFFLIWAFMSLPIGVLSTILLLFCIPVIAMGWLFVDSSHYV